MVEQELSNSNDNNHFLDEYNGRPTVEKINQILIRKRASGDKDRKIWVSVEWALEMAEHYTANTSFTYSMMHNAPNKLCAMEKNMLQAQDRANLADKKAQDLLVENALVYDRLQEISTQMKEKEDALSDQLEKNRVIKLPISRVNSFLMFCKKEQLENPTEHFYIKIDDNGNMERIVRNPEELK